jgi:hypothetical protein
VSGRPIPYKELLDALQHTAGNIWQIPGAEHITLRIEPSSSGYCAIWRHDLATNQWWDGTQWQADTRYIHDIYRWKVEDAVHAVQPLLTAEKADAAKNTAWRKARAERAKSLAEVVDELLDPIREAVAS